MAKKKEAAPEAVVSEAKPKSTPKAKKEAKVVKLNDSVEITSQEGVQAVEMDLVDPAQINLDQVIDEVKAEKEEGIISKLNKGNQVKKAATKKKAEPAPAPVAESDPLGDLFEDSALQPVETPIADALADLLEPAPAPEPAPAQDAKKPAREKKEKVETKPRQKGKEKLPEPIPVEFVPDEDINSIFIDNSVEKAEELAEVQEVEQPKEEPKPEPKAKSKASSKPKKKEAPVKELPVEEPKPEPAEPNPAPFVPEEMADNYAGLFVPDSFYTKKALVLEYLRGHYECLNLNEVGRQAMGSKIPIHNFQEMILGKRKMPDKLVHPVYMFLAYKFGVGQGETITMIDSPYMGEVEAAQPEFTRPPFGILFYQAEDGLVHAIDAGNIDFINEANADGMVLVNGENFDSRELTASFSAAALHVGYIYQYLSAQ